MKRFRNHILAVIYNKESKLESDRFKVIKPKFSRTNSILDVLTKSVRDHSRSKLYLGKLPEKDFNLILNDELAPFRKEQLIYVSLEIYEDGESVTLPVFSHPVSVMFLKVSDWLRGVLV